MMDDCKNVMNTSHTEQSIVASIVCLRLIGEQFPKSLSVHFRRKDFEKAKKMFNDWYTETYDSLPAERRDAIKTEAQAEFDLFEESILKKNH